ncbi:carbohydrate ABC transporter substrate-binding protein (CUT1 family) [Haloactinopolyspora alba]|uniref:Carbohydrate ABC transporter substrate-binding protein (CUT1 family) n=1 Tax=Haloactinopolyspora alba TaxID=648780 RepID=A0A2P8DNA0_9ACTN|nr:sugar ABC transporter substrate-binding protein [Haloactinopolyspora alba]PSK98679.1 carbohydrate ABC transporter substrate-binding protein (CUT1 family) [Haloactinopolyspora alba]
MRARRIRIAAGLGAVALTTACAGAGSLTSGSSDATTIVVAIVSNPQMTDAISLSDQFTEEHPNINVDFVSLPENESRAKITASVATGGGEFDVVMVSNYETSMWAENGWLVNLQPYADATENYDTEDFLEPVRESLSYEGDMYSVPFYGESSFLVYRKDIFDEAGLTMPEQPTWQEVRDRAAAVEQARPDMDGICLRGLAGWGENLAPLNTVINTFGGRWFDQDWNAQLDSPEVREAVEFYVDLVQEHGQEGAATTGFAECATRYGQGRTAMWYDATSMVNVVESPDDSVTAGLNGYAQAPVVETEASGWLYTWSLAIPSTTEHADEAWEFISWMTDKEYAHTVAEAYGWERVPPGARQSTYEIPEYAEVAEAYAEPTLQAIRNANQDTTMTRPVPYEGIQFLAIPEFQDLGTRVGQQISAAIAGQISVEEALEQSQNYAETVGESYQQEEGE